MSNPDRGWSFVVDLDLTEEESHSVAHAVNRSLLFDPDFRSVFEVNRERWKREHLWITQDPKNTGLGPRKKIMKKKKTVLVSFQKIVVQAKMGGCP